jgi:RNA polymerase-binding transcription factor DksA
MISQDLASELREQLLAEKQRLEQEIVSLDQRGVRSDVFQDDETDAVDQHPADDASGLFEREKNMSVIFTLQRSLEEVNAALRKFDEGTYGICEECGRPIGEKRLRAFPAATHCIEDQSKIDRAGSANT